MGESFDGDVGEAVGVERCAAFDGERLLEGPQLCLARDHLRVGGVDAEEAFQGDEVAAFPARRGLAVVLRGLRVEVEVGALAGGYGSGGFVEAAGELPLAVGLPFGGVAALLQQPFGGLALGGGGPVGGVGGPAAGVGEQH